MPPNLPRKRLRSQSPGPPPHPGTRNGTTKKAKIAPARKATLFDDLDATSTPGRGNLALASLDDSDSSLTSLADSDFAADQQPGPSSQERKRPARDDDDDDDEAGLVFEDVPAPAGSAGADVAPLVLRDLQLDLTKDTRLALDNVLGRRGPTKLERRVRVATHCLHVQCLLFHNAVRNAWACDALVRGIVLSHVPPKLWEEVDRWRRNSGLDKPVAAPSGPGPKTARGAGKTQGRGRAQQERARDWGDAAERLELGAVDMSHGDPLFRLMKALAAC
ncbi:hypothetical protein P8C59_003004 [Phyllachora maydis]|uniref:Uncharacterized protein n=1 Tax=Phyllachora maydis TaxID=1825666 RepID=A0AAD9I0K3_9PEZI|nr:hypothetical protein P8C59_003004 [Phyllachora maydis]